MRHILVEAIARPPAGREEGGHCWDRRVVRGPAEKGCPSIGEEGELDYLWWGLGHDHDVKR